MKKLFLVAALAMTGALHAQNTFLNNEMVNSTGELFGTARYVGMGGAMGALGADISTMAYNPAGIALYRRSDIALTAGAIWNNTSTPMFSNASATLDQMGAVLAMNTYSGHSFVFGFNYQKKQNFNHAFHFTEAALGGLSQMGMLADLVNGGYDTYDNLAGAALDYGFLQGAADYAGNPIYQQDQEGNTILDKDGKPVPMYKNGYDQTAYDYAKQSWGSLQGFDIDFAYNYEDRLFLGLDLGFDNLEYHSYSKYSEYSEYYKVDTYSDGDYSLNNDHKVTGWGFNIKVGAIVRPWEDNPFRVGLAVETPTWYSLRNSTLYQLCDKTNHGYPEDESFLPFNLNTPWKFRLSVGSTIGTNFAWDIDYELANWARMRQSYSEGGYKAKDHGMNQLTSDNLACMHVLRAGMEYKPTSKWALRVGYNFASAPTKSNVGYDQYFVDSYAMDFCTSTNYMRLKPAHTLTLGVGYKGKHFYADLAYKLRGQKADFYAFDTTFAQEGNFYADLNPSMANATIAPVSIDRTRHQITATIGVKF